MAVIDYSTDIGKLRMRIADVSDLPFLQDSVYAGVLAEKGGNLNASAIALASMILGQLAFKTHRKLQQLEVWGSEAFDSYSKFLVMTVKDPAFMNCSPIPYAAGITETHPLIQFASDWNKNFTVTQSQQLAFDASNSPNDGSTYGVLGSASGSGWQVVE